MAKFSQGMAALDRILGMNSKEAETFIRSTIGDSAGVKGATDVVGDIRYHFARAAGAGGLSRNFTEEMGSLGKYGYSADDGRKLLRAARSWQPTNSNVFYGTTDGIIATGSDGLQQARRASKVKARRAAKNQGDTSGVLYAGHGNNVSGAMTGEQFSGLRGTWKGLETRGSAVSHSIDELDNTSLKSYNRKIRRESEVESAKLRKNPVSEVEHGRLSEGDKKLITQAFGGERTAEDKALDRHLKKLNKANRTNEVVKTNETIDESDKITSNWLPSNGNTRLESAQRNIDARAAFRSEEGLRELDQLQAKYQQDFKDRVSDKFSRDLDTPTNSMSKAELMNRESDYRHLFDTGEVHTRSDYENYGNRLVKKTPETTTAETSTAGSSTSELQYGAGIGGNTTQTGEEISKAMKKGAPVPEPAPEPIEVHATSEQGKKVSEDMRNGNPNTPAAPDSGKPVPQDAGFSGGAGTAENPLSYYDEKMAEKGISNQDKHKFGRVKNDHQNFLAEETELKKKGLSEEEYAKEYNKLKERYGIGAEANPTDFFRGQANEKATTWDWIRGNNVIEIGAGGAIAAGAIASCFSNKGKMSNSELYGQNF